VSAPLAPRQSAPAWRRTRLHREAAPGVLLGAADVRWQASGGVRYPPEQGAYEAELATVRGELSSETFAAAWAEGRAMSREQAVDYGLELIRVSTD